MLRGWYIALLATAAACGGGNSAATCELASDCTGTASFCELATGQCIAPPSLDACNRVETCTLADKPYCTDDSMGVCVECTDGSHCGDGEVCDQGSNECIVLACTEGTAGDAQCAAADPSLAYCGPDESCVACLESAHCTAAASAVCDQNDLECRGCIANTECDSKVCGTDTGVCASETDIVYVAKSGTDGASCGTLANPCLTIDGDEGGLAKVTASRNTVLVAAGDYVEQITLADITVALVGEEEMNINPSLGADETAVLVSGSSNVSFTNVKIRLDGGSASSVALKCDSAGGTPSLSFSQGTVSGSGGLGVLVTGCNLSITQSKISANQGGGISIANSDFALVNNVIVNNGQDGTSGSDKGGVSFSSTAGKTEVFAFNTLSGNGIDDGAIGGSAVTCSSTNLSAANNIIVADGQGGGGGLIVGTSCSHAYSITDGGAPVPGGTNIIGDPLFVNAGEGDYNLQSTSPCIDAADPAATLDTDIDGDIRPQGDARDMGADEAG